MNLDELAKAIKDTPPPTREEIKNFWREWNKIDAENQKRYEAERKQLTMSYEDYHKPFDI